MPKHAPRDPMTNEGSHAKNIPSNPTSIKGSTSGDRKNVMGSKHDQDRKSVGAAGVSFKPVANPAIGNHSNGDHKNVK